MYQELQFYLSYVLSRSRFVPNKGPEFCYYVPCTTVTITKALENCSEPLYELPSASVDATVLVLGVYVHVECTGMVLVQVEQVSANLHPFGPEPGASNYTFCFYQMND